MDTDTINRVRAAIKDRAIWFALLYRTFREVLPREQVEALCRRAIFEFGRMKAKSDPADFSSRAWVERHVEKGSAAVFDSDIRIEEGRAVQNMKHCALVEAWKEMGLPAEEIALFCDIAMEGDRGRAAAHGIRMELAETIGKGDCFCNLVVYDDEVKKA